KTGEIKHTVDLSRLPDYRDYDLDPHSFLYVRDDGKLGLVNTWGIEHQGNLVDLETGKLTPLPGKLPSTMMKYGRSPAGRHVYAYGFFQRKGRDIAQIYDVISGKLLFETVLKTHVRETEKWSFHCTESGEIFLANGNDEAVEIFDVARNEHH